MVKGNPVTTIDEIPERMQLSVLPEREELENSLTLHKALLKKGGRHMEIQSWNWCWRLKKGKRDPLIQNTKVFQVKEEENDPDEEPTSDNNYGNKHSRSKSGEPTQYILMWRNQQKRTEEGDGLRDYEWQTGHKDRNRKKVKVINYEHHDLQTIYTRWLKEEGVWAD